MCQGSGVAESEPFLSGYSDGSDSNCEQSTEETQIAYRCGVFLDMVLFRHWCSLAGYNSQLVYQLSESCSIFWTF